MTDTAVKTERIGKITQIMGPVIDVLFDSDALPEIYNALEITREDGNKVIAEVQQHLGDNAVRTVAMGATEGLKRGMSASDTGGPIAAPVGEGTLGRIINVVGEPIDEAGPLKVTEHMPIHRAAPPMVDLTVEP